MTIHPRRPRVRRTAALAALALLAAASPAVATSGPTAELSSGQLFMGTTKVEVGARANGSFGSTVAAPAGYHPRSNNGPILGFRVNPDECDWDAVGCVTRGDYFTPGSPYESWGVQIGNGGTPVYNDNTGTGVAGAFTSADAAHVSGVWQSSADVGGVLAVKLTYSVPSYGWLIDATAELTNTSGSPLTDVYFLRGLDPDNCRMETAAVCDNDGDGVADGTGNFRTLNTVVSQGSATTAAAVTATQTNDTFLALRPAGPQARVARQGSGFSNPVTISSVWDGSNGAYAFADGSTAFGDAGIYGVVRVPSIAPGATARVDMQYAVKGVPPAADVTATSPQEGVLIDVPGGNAAGVCSVPAHGTAVVEGGRVRYTPTPGYAGTDSFMYSTGGPCGTVSVTVRPAAATPPPPAAAKPPVTRTGPPASKTLSSGGLRLTQPLHIDRSGRYTFMYVDPATGRRVRQQPGSRVGGRTLDRRYSAPVLVTRADGADVVLTSVFAKAVRTTVRLRMTLRIVRKAPDGTLTDVTPAA